MTCHLKNFLIRKRKEFSFGNSGIVLRFLLYLFVCLFIYLFIYLFILFVCLFIYLVFIFVVCTNLHRGSNFVLIQNLITAHEYFLVRSDL